MPTSPSRAPSTRGSALLYVMGLILLLAVAGVALVRYAGQDRIDAARFAGRDPGLACAEAGLQYARRYFGSRYATSNNWNDFLDPATGYRFDEGADDAPPDLATVRGEARGMSDGSALDPGADLDGDEEPDFWVSIRDDDDERPLGVPANDPDRDNNETIIIRSECTNPAFARVSGGVEVNAVVESALSHVQGSSGYGIAAGGSNSPDLVGNL
jgi:hypothetical protein